MSEEIFDIVNERDEVVGQNTRREVHARGLWHRAVHVLVFNARGEVFLQKRSMLKDTARGKWDSSSSGHLDSGEDYDACAVREMREEIGLELPATGASLPLRRLFKVDARKETGWEFCWVYRCESEGPFVLHPDEIETGAWFAPDAVAKWANEKPQDFASAFVLIWKKYFATETQSRRGEQF
jgi:isopentenyldiphosphate isomerase